MSIPTVSPEEAYKHCNLDDLPFETTNEVEKLSRFIGQDRALEAVEFGISMPHEGFNLFVIGPEGSGRHSVVQSFIDRQAKEEPAATDWCYVYNFEQPHIPLALEFPPKRGQAFKQDMQELITTLKVTVPAAFEADDYRARLRALGENLKQRVDNIYETLIAKGRKQSIAVVRNEQGIVFSPMDGSGNPMDLESFKKLPEATQKSIEENIEKLHEDLQQTVHDISRLNKESKEQKEQLKQDTARQCVGHLIKRLKNTYGNQQKVLHYLACVEQQLIEHVEDFFETKRSDQHVLFGLHPEPPSFSQYDVNVLIPHETDGAPVVYEDMPTYQNLHGRIEHQAKMGMLTTDFSLVRPGSLHRANGGYIIIDARRLLMQPFAYEGLKRTLRSGKINMEPIERLLGLVSTVTLEPEPIDLNVKVVLIGEPMIYYLLNAYDPEFGPLFKVQADFEHDMQRTSENHKQYAALIAGFAGEKEFLPLHKTAVARVIEEASRHAGDSNKVSLHIGRIADVVKEADYIARKADKELITPQEINEALLAAKRRAGRIRDRVFESIHDNIRHIETTGGVTGQVNGLSVVQIGDDSFGFPTRITAVTRPGKGDIIDIEREVELGGPLHSKGVMILSGFLKSRYARNIPFGLQASLVFEQSYGGVEGDSASCAELCALLSSLAGVPIQQGLAITGSVSQRGEVQSIGGVNEKIEGYFDVCKSQGLNGKQGVLIPQTNKRHLMLKQEVVEAIANKEFTIYLISTVDEAITLLTECEAGERNAAGVYPPDTINGRVEEALHNFAQDLRAFSQKEE